MLMVLCRLKLAERLVGIFRTLFKIESDSALYWYMAEVALRVGLLAPWSAR